MDGVSEITAAGSLWKVGGKEYRLSPLTLQDYGEIEKRILEGRTKSPLAAVAPHLAGLPEGIATHLANLAYRDEKRAFVDRFEVQDWLTTMSGHIFRMYLMARHGHPELTVDQVAELIREADDDDATQRLAEANMGMPSGNSNGRATTMSPNPAETNGTDGETSTSPSPGAGSSRT